MTRTAALVCCVGVLFTATISQAQLVAVRGAILSVMHLIINPSVDGSIASSVGQSQFITILGAVVAPAQAAAALPCRCRAPRAG